MFTCLLGYIAGKYNTDFGIVFLFTVLADIAMWDAIGKIFS